MVDTDAIRKRWNLPNLPWRFVMIGGANQESPEPPEWWVQDCNGMTIATDWYPGDGNSVFAIAHAPEDIQALLAEIEWLRAENRSLKW